MNKKKTFSLILKIGLSIIGVPLFIVFLFFSYHELTYKERGYKYMCGYENANDTIIDFIGDHYWFVGKLELIVQDQSDLWANLKKRHYLQPTTREFTIPKSLEAVTRNYDNLRFERYENPFKEPEFAFALHCQNTGIVYITWLGDL